LSRSKSEKASRRLRTSCGGSEERASRLAAAVEASLAAKVLDGLDLLGGVDEGRV
jgi:hypothetical protein